MTPVEEYARDAYVRLEVDPAAVAKAPRISHLFRHAGGVLKVWECLENCAAPEARQLIEFRDRLSEKELAAVPFEAIAIAAGLTTKRAFGVISEALVEFSQDAAKLILHAAAPDMMEKAVERAKGDKGTTDGKLLLQALNFIPRPKNTFTVVNGDVVKGNKNQTVVLPSAEDTARRLGNRFNMEMRIPAAIPAPETEESDEYEGEEDEDAAL